MRGACRRCLGPVAEDRDPTKEILDFLAWDEPDGEPFVQNVRAVLAAAGFSRELTTAVVWLRERDVDVRCVRMRPYTLEDRLLIDVRQIIPLPDTADCRVQIREKTRGGRARPPGPRR